MCGVVITVPKPQVSELDKMPQFDYRKFMVQEINHVFPFPALPANAVSFLPAKPATREPGKQSEQWINVRNRWEQPGYGESAPLDAVAMWVDVGKHEFGWRDEKVDNGTNAMTGRRPEELVKELEAYYLWPPFLSATSV